MASEEDKKKLEENLKYLQQREKGIIHSSILILFKDLQERIDTFDQQKERQSQLLKDLKDKESQLIQIQNEVSSKTKLLNLANQELPKKEARSAELDKLIKAKELQLKELEDRLKVDGQETKQQLEKMSLQFTDSQKQLAQVQDTLSQREEAMDSYKKKIVALEFQAEDNKKQKEDMILRIQQLEEQIKAQSHNMQMNYKKIVEINDAISQTDSKDKNKKKDKSSDDEDKKLKKKQDKQLKLKAQQEEYDSQIVQIQQNFAQEREAFLRQIKELQDYISDQNQQIERLEQSNNDLIEKGLNSTQQMEIQIKYENEKEENSKLRIQLQEIQARNREQEVRIAQTEQRLNQTTIELNEQALQTDAHKQKICQQQQKIKDLKSEVKSISAEKDEYEQSLQKKQSKVKLLQQERLVLEEELQNREAELENKSKVMERIGQQNEDLKKENQKLSLKIRQIQATQLKDLQKKLRDKDAELDVLKEMLRSAQLQSKGKETEIQRLQKKIQRMQKEGYVDKIQGQYMAHRNNNHLQQYNNQRQQSKILQQREEDQEEEEEEFYDNEDSVEQEAKTIQRGKNTLTLPDISHKSAASSQFNSIVENSLTMQNKRMNHNIIPDQELDEHNLSGMQLLKQKRRNQKDEGNKVFEEQYNKLVDDYQKNASTRQFKFSSIGVTEAFEQSPNIKVKKLQKGYGIYSSVDQLRRDTYNQSERSAASGPRKQPPKLINILEEKADYLVISPPKIR